AELVARRAEKNDPQSRLSKIDLRAGVFALQDSHHADRWRRIDGPPFRLVVEGDIARHHRRAERVAGVADPSNALRELPHDLRPFRRADVEAVGDGHRPSTADGDVPRGFGHGLLAAFIRIETAAAGLD